MRMGRKRTRDRHLPTSVYHRHGAYYFVDHAGKWIRLGKSLGDAYRALAGFVESTEVKTVADLCDRYTREVLPSYSDHEQKGRGVHLARIRAVFGAMIPTDVTGREVPQFGD